MEISEPTQELLEELWTELEETQKDSIGLNELGLDKDSSEISELVDLGLILFPREMLLKFTDEGRAEAEKAIRRHRLAERLLSDILETKHQLIESKACKFEHLLYEGMDESICILLGHPKVCPHGRPIPPGECCRKEKEVGKRLVAALADLNPGQGGKIAYVQAKESQEIQKLMAIGILPGTSINLIRRFPSYVFQVGNTQYAVDREIADEIYVRLENQEE
ncbi:MAG: metal-dependent transcriptional regulator [Candidatus Poribacteria bacterium]